MSAASVARLTCDHPECSAAVEAPGTAYDYETGRTPPPDGWTVAEGRFLGRRTVACPEHAPELREAERARYEWECAEVAARNAWTKANPPPRVAAWIDPNAPRGRRR